MSTIDSSFSFKTCQLASPFFPRVQVSTRTQPGTNSTHGVYEVEEALETPRTSTDNTLITGCQHADRCQNERNVSTQGRSYEAQILGKIETNVNETLKAN